MLAGTIFETNNCGLIRIVKYNGWDKVDIVFAKTGHSATVRSTDLRSGQIKDKNLPFVYGVGFVGYGDHKSKINRKNTSSYTRWISMLTRCYCEKTLLLQPTYRGVTVCEEWHNYQNFALWYKNNYPDDGNDYALDKDIKVDGNKVYGPDFCLFVSLAENNIKARAENYKLINPSGCVIEVYNMAAFCVDNNLNQPCMSMVINGSRKHHKGWRKG